MNFVNYIKHSLYSPDVYHRDFENDLPPEESMAKRIGLVVLPFLSLYRPVGSFLSTGMGLYRIATHVKGALSAEQEKAWLQMSKHLFLITVASLALASTLFNFTLGTLVTMTVDEIQGVHALISYLSQGEYIPALEEGLSVIANQLYIVFMLFGGLECMLAFCLVQALLSLVQARGEFVKGRYLEGCAKVVLSSFRCQQAHQYYQSIQRRNFLLKIEKYKALIERADKGRQCRHLLKHPLNDLEAQTEEKKVVLVDAQGNEHEFGAHFHGFGKQLVKGDNLTLRKKIIDGKEVLELDFKINHVFRDKIQNTIEELKRINPKETKEILQLTQSHVAHIKIEKGEFFDLGSGYFNNLAEAEKINLVGLGTIFIGSTSDSPNLYDRVVVHIPSTSTIYDLHEMISFLDLEEALKLSTFEDIDRIKLGHLYRIFFPREATPFERTEEFFALPLHELKEKMFQQTPLMKEVYEHYFHKMKPYEILPGKIRYQVTGLSEEAYRLGARAFTAAVMGAYKDKDLYERIGSILKMGMISTETRMENEFDSHGLGGSGIDFFSGGADSVYTQMFTEQNIREEMPIDNLYYNSKVRLVIKLEALETGTYQYHEDSFGTRRLDSDSWWLEDLYRSRENILEFIKQSHNQFSGGHEIMFKERLDPAFIQGLIVQDQKTYDDCLQHLRICNMVQKDVAGQETILNVPVGQFIRIGTHLTQEWFS